MSDSYDKGPKMGNAFAQQEYEDLDSPPAEYHDYLRSPKPRTAHAITVNLPKTVPPQVTTTRKRAHIQPATPLIPGYVHGIRQKFNQKRSVTDSAVPAPLQIESKAATGHDRGKSRETSQDLNRSGEPPESSSLSIPSQQGSPGWTVTSSSLWSPDFPGPHRASEEPRRAEKLGRDARQTQSTPVASTRSPPELRLQSGTYSEGEHEYGVETVGGLSSVNVVTAPSIKSASGQFEHAESMQKPEPSPTSIYSPNPGMTDAPPPVPPKATYRHLLEGGNRQLGQTHQTGPNPAPVLGSPSSNLHPSFDRPPGPPAPTEPAFTSPQFFHNHAPPPPGFPEPPSPPEFLVAGIMGIHHHVDREAGAISRSIVAKHDHLMDQLMRQSDKTIDRVSKVSHDLHHDIVNLKDRMDRNERRLQEIKKELDESYAAYDERARELMQQAARAGGEVNDRLDEMNARMATLDVKVDHIADSVAVTDMSSTPLTAQTFSSTTIGHPGSRNAFASMGSGLNSPSVAPHMNFGRSSGSFGSYPQHHQHHGSVYGSNHGLGISFPPAASGNPTSSSYGRNNMQHHGVPHPPLPPPPPHPTPATVQQPVYVSQRLLQQGDAFGGARGGGVGAGHMNNTPSHRQPQLRGGIQNQSQNNQGENPHLRTSPQGPQQGTTASTSTTSGPRGAHYPQQRRGTWQSPTDTVCPTFRESPYLDSPGSVSVSEGIGRGGDSLAAVGTKQDHPSGSEHGKGNDRMGPAEHHRTASENTINTGTAGHAITTSGSTATIQGPREVTNTPTLLAARLNAAVAATSSIPSSAAPAVGGRPQLITNASWYRSATFRDDDEEGGKGKGREG
ncbi:MAG: hypothetical protein M1817_001257 [Caeruleum heppii]|nr:MAG: hypothetical protein M1817_001257 [Caeruleum heppii]